MYSFVPFQEDVAPKVVPQCDLLSVATAAKVCADLDPKLAPAALKMVKLKLAEYTGKVSVQFISSVKTVSRRTYQL